MRRIHPQAWYTTRPTWSIYWWNDTIAECRRVSIAARRQLTRCRCRGTDEEISVKKQTYKKAKKKLKLEIKKAKNHAWNELIFTINEDPWGLPYKIVLNKLRAAGPGLSEKLTDHVLNRLLDSLFPAEASVSAADVAWNTPIWDDAWQVSITEVNDVLKKAATRNVAPGPD